MVGVWPCRQRDGIFTRLVESAETSMDIVTGTTQQLEIFSAARKNVKVRVESQQFAQKDVWKDYVTRGYQKFLKIKANL